MGVLHEQNRSDANAQNGPTVSSILHAKNHFQVLGLPAKRCGGADLKRAYKTIALRVHPDKCSDDGAIEAFRRLQEAFSVLSDPSLHARYAQTLAHAKSMAEARAASGRARDRNRDYAQRAAEERVAKERARVAKLEAEEKHRQKEAMERREAAEKALNSARSRSTPRRTPRREENPLPLDPEAQKAAEERSRRRAASMAMLGAAMRWEMDETGHLRQFDKNGREVKPPPSKNIPGGDGAGSTYATPRSRGTTPRRPSSARESPGANPFGDLKSLRRAQTERTLRRPSSARPVAATQYLPRFMQHKAQKTTVVSV